MSTPTCGRHCQLTSTKALKFETITEFFYWEWMPLKQTTSKTEWKKIQGQRLKKKLHRWPTLSSWQNPPVHDIVQRVFQEKSTDKYVFDENVKQL